MKTIHGLLEITDEYIATPYFHYTIETKEVLLGKKLFEKDFKNTKYSTFVELEVPDKEAYKIINKAILNYFAKLLYIEHNVQNNPRADKVWQLAYEYGHASGLHEVASYFYDLVVLIQD